MTTNLSLPLYSSRLKKCTRLRFTIKDDITLLRQVLSLNPFCNTRRWHDIKMVINNESGKDFTVRAIREHVEHLINLFQRQDIANLKKSGTEEEYHQKRELLEQVIEVTKDLKNSKYGKRILKEPEISDYFPDEKSAFQLETIEDIKSSPYEQESNTPSNFENSEDNSVIKILVEEPHVDSLNESTNPHKRRLSFEDPTVEYLREKRFCKEKELQIQDKQLELEERRLEFEKEKMKMEEEEKTQRLAIELEERRHNLAAAEQQRKLIETLTLEVIKERQTIKEKELEILEKKLELEERRLKLEEEKMKKEQEDRAERLAFEMEERKHRLTMIEQQQKLIEALITLRNKN